MLQSPGSQHSEVNWLPSQYDREAIKRDSQWNWEKRRYRVGSTAHEKMLTSLKSWMLQMKYGVFGLRLSIYTQSLKEKENLKQWHLPLMDQRQGP